MVGLLLWSTATPLTTLPYFIQSATVVASEDLVPSELIGYMGVYTNDFTFIHYLTYTSGMVSSKQVEPMFHQEMEG